VAVERVFLGWDEPLLPLAARFLVERYGREGSVDLRQASVVLPGARAGRRLKELLLEYAVARGARLNPPRMVPVGGLAEIFYTPNRHAADAFLLRQVWIAVLRDSLELTTRPLFGDLPTFDDLAGWSRLADRVVRLQREVAGGGHYFADVARICESDPGQLFDDSDRWSGLAHLQADYRRRLKTLGVCDLDLERIERVGDLSAPAVGQVWLVGVTELPRVVEKIALSAGTRLGALIHAPSSESSAFGPLGLIETAAWRDRDLEIPDEAIRIADRPADQAAVALEEIAELGAAATGEVVVAQSNDALVPYLREWLEAAGLPVHYAGGTPMAASAPYRLLTAISAYLERREWEEFAALLRHPDFEVRLREVNRRGDPDATPSRLDAEFARLLPSHLRRASGRETNQSHLDAVRRYIDGSDLLAPLAGPGSLPLHQWPIRILDALVEIYSAVDLNPRSPDGRRFLAVLDRIRSAALAMHRLPPALSPNCDAVAAIELLVEAIGGEIIPDDPDGAPVELLGWLELAHDDAPHVIVAGVNEGDLPESVNGDAFLPDRLRVRLGLRSNDTRFARDAFQLSALLKSRQTVRLISGRLSGTGDPLRPSRLLLAARGERLARRVLAYTNAGGGPDSREAPMVALAGARSQFMLPPEPELTFNPPTRLRVTDFRLVLEDPYRYVLESIMRLESIDDQARELDGLSFGSLAHAVLERFGSSAERNATDAAVIARRLDSLIDAEAATRFGQRTYPAVHLQVEQLRLRLRRFADWQASRARDGWSIVMVEGTLPDTTPMPQRVGPLLAPFSVDGEDVVLSGRIDRIDYHHGTGSWALLDYKTGDIIEKPEVTHRDGRTKDWKDLQLPLYRHLAATILDRDGNPLIPAGAPIVLGYVSVSSELGSIGDLMADWDDAALMTADEAARRVVRTLRTGRAEFVRSALRVRQDDPLAALFGVRQLVAADVATLESAGTTE